MMNYYSPFGSLSGWGDSFGMGSTGVLFAPVVLLLIVWSLYWKFHALWHAAKSDEKWWFLGLMVINTLGIVEILYLYYFSRKTLKHNENNTPMLPPTP